MCIRDRALTAREVVNSYSEQQLREIISTYGEERYAGRIAAAITARRKDRPIETTAELSEIVRCAMPAAARREKQHPACLLYTSHGRCGTDVTCRLGRAHAHRV